MEDAQSRHRRNASGDREQSPPRRRHEHRQAESITSVVPSTPVETDSDGFYLPTRQYPDKRKRSPEQDAQQSAKRRPSKGDLLGARTVNSYIDTYQPLIHTYLRSWT